MGIMSAAAGIAAKNPLLTALSGGALIPTLLAMRGKKSSTPAASSPAGGVAPPPSGGSSIAGGPNPTDTNLYRTNSFFG